MKSIKLFSILFSMSLFSFNCNETSESEKIASENLSDNKPKTEVAQPIDTPKSNEADIRTFLHSIEGTNGWQTTSDSISYDYFEDGRLHIQGPDGEATMWTGTWKLAGDQLTMVCKDIQKDETVTVKIDGEKLVLGDKVYTRYKPN